MLYLKASDEIKILSEYDGTPGLYLKTFALSDQRNKNGWRVTWDSIKNNISDFVKNSRPGIDYTKCVDQKCDLDHVEASSFNRTINLQEDFRVSNIVGYTLNEDTHTAYAIHQITDSKFAELVKSGQRIFVSPMIWPVSGGYDVKGTNEKGLPILDVYNWKAVHIAFVNDPAFGDDAKITAMCEGNDCQMRLLSAKQLTTEKRNSLEDSQFAYVDSNGKGHLPIHDAAHVRNAMSRFNQTDIPNDQKDKVKSKICRAAKRFNIESDFCKNGISADELSPLIQVPLIVKHKGNLVYATISAKASDEIEEIFLESYSLNAKIVTDVLRTNSFSACSCSADHTMSETKEVQDKIDQALSAAKKATEETMATKDAKIKELQSKIAKMKADMNEEDDNEEEDDNNDNENDNNDTKKKNSKGSKAKTEDPILKALAAKVAEPMISEMLKARESQGISEEQIKKFETALRAKSLADIESQYNDEKVFIAAISAKQEHEGVHLPFNGSNESGGLTAKSIEELLGDESD